MALGRQLRSLNLTDAERNTLRSWTRKPKTAQALVQRAKIILLCDKGMSNDAVATQVGTSGATVCKWRERFRQARLQGLSDAPRSGPPREIGDDAVEKVIQKTLTSRPKNATHWR